MKRNIIVLSASLLFISMYFFSCDLLDVEKEFWLEHTFIVQGNNTNFDEDYLLDAAAESDVIEEYADLIKSIKILEVTYEVTYHNGDATQQINTATLTVSDASGNGPVTIGTVTNQNLASLVGNVQNLAFNQAGVDRAADLIKNPPHAFLLNLAGSANEAPLDFGVKFRFKVKMVANPT
jgi:capsular polysaccharide biosynthesis protein